MSTFRTKSLAAMGALALLAACSKPTPPAPAADTAAPAEASTDSLAAREAEVQKREAELASREAALADNQAGRDRDRSGGASTSRPASKPPVSKPSGASGTSTAAATPRTLIVPAGTQLALSLTTELSTKSTKAGDVVRAELTSDVRVDGQVAIAAGTTVAGQVTNVVSGSNKIGGVPSLGMSFERLELPGGKDVPISGEITQQGKSDTARDTVKIVGGAAAGAILGHQIKGGDKGKVLGGLLGGAIGAVAAQKTGTEVQLPAGTALNIALAAPVEITR
ncbi:MAG TPA: glycine zipper 2TM domain-containing protein [Steroidobacteraceae bacterium]|nr:glycine zipper 2TM domain-containing protein [Steroidobacteraceae bacterium]